MAFADFKSFWKFYSINDGRRPAVHAFQQECTNRLKVLCSKGKVLNVQVKQLFVPLLYFCSG